MRTSSFRHMRAEGRETLRLGLAHGHSLRARASMLERAHNTVSRELGHTRTRGHPSRAWTAQVQAATRARQPRRPRKPLDLWLWPYVRTVNDHLKLPPVRSREIPP
ncbi:MAG: helix-turn-helix domain-containing protein, partial [Nitrospirota bacterium]